MSTVPEEGLKLAPVCSQLPTRVSVYGPGSKAPEERITEFVTVSVETERR